MKQIARKHFPLTVTRGHIARALGVLWLLDGALQLQHQMFTKQFVTQVITPATVGQPRFVTGPMHFNEHLFLMHPAIFNSLIALIQLGLGVAILWKPTVKWGLLASTGWALFVWVIGEGYGGLFSGQSSLLMGSPGAALLYAILAVAILPWPLFNFRRANFEAGKTAAFWLIFVWVALWFGGVYWQLTTAGMNTTAGMKAMVTANANGAPGWLAAVDRHAASFIKSSGTYVHPMQTGQSMSAMQMAQMPVDHGSGGWLIPVLALLMLLVSLGVLLKGSFRKVALALGIGLSFIFWLVIQNLGMFYTGTATDPNSGPLLILLALALYGCTDLDAQLKRLTDKLDGPADAA